MINSYYLSRAKWLLAGSFIVCMLSFYPAKKNNRPNSLLPDIAQIDKVVEDEMIKQEIYGCAVGVVKDGQIVHVKTYGYKDRLRTNPFTENTVFRWASISKTLTAVAAFKAIETGKLQLDEKVSKYVSYWPTSGNKGDITIRHLLNNRSGIPHYGDNYNAGAYHSSGNFNARECVSTFSNASLRFLPGSDYLYTTFGFNLLGAAIEEATGIPYESYVDVVVANKANIESLTPYPAEPGGYEKDCNGFLRKDIEGNTEWKLPGGGWGSTILGLTKFMQGLINGTFLNNTAALWGSVPENANQGESYSFGINSNRAAGETLKVYHGGDHDGLRTYLIFYPNSKLGVVCMFNGGKYADRSRLCSKIFRLFGKTDNTSNLPANQCGEETNCGDKTIGIWRKTDNAEGTVIRRGYTSDEFNAEWKWLGEKGYYCADFNTYERSGTRRWDGIFKKTTKQSAMIRGYSHNDFNAKWQELSSQGYRLFDIETYTEDGGLFSGSVRKWAGLFIKMEGGYYLHREMSQDELHNKWIDYGKQGLKLIDIERYDDKWAGVWVKGDDVAMVRNYETVAFRDKRRELNSRGWRLIDADTYMDGSTRKWSGLWEKSTVPEHYLYGYSYCDWLKTYHADYVGKGYELMDIETY